MIGTAMDQASRVMARWSAGEDASAESAALMTRERLACGAWKRAVGKRLADRTRAVKLVRDRLVVEVEDEIWRKNLWALRWQIMKNLERAIGPGIVADVEFRVMPARREPARETGAEGLVVPADEATEIADPGLRRIYRSARRRETA